MNQPWIYMCSPSGSPLLPPSPSHCSGSSQCTSPEHLSHASNLGWWSVSPLIVYLFQCYSLRTSHPRLLPQSPKVCSIHLCPEALALHNQWAGMGKVVTWLPILQELPALSFTFPALLLLFSHSVVPSSLRPHGLQHARLLCPPLSPRVHSHSCPLSQWHCLIISSSGAPFSSCPQSFPASGSFLISWLFASGGQSMEIQLQH